MPLPQLAPVGGFAEAQDTTFSTDVVARFICNTWAEATQEPEGIDVVVIGAGLFGGYCASKIFELSRDAFSKEGAKPLRVLVLEAGPFVVPEHTQNIPNLGFYDPGIFQTTNSGSGSPSVTRNFVWGLGWRSNEPFVGQAYCVGGKGVFWGGWCPRLQAVDLADWPEEVRDYLTKADAGAPVGRRPISHREPGTEVVLERDEPLSGYEALEYEIGVSPSDDFVFDPVAVARPSDQGTRDPAVAPADPRAVGLNEAVRTFLRQEQGQIDPRITQVLPAPIAVQTQSFVSGLFALDKYSSVPALTASVRLDHGADGRSTDLRMALVPKAHVVRLECGQSDESPVGTRQVERIIVATDGKVETLQLGPQCQVVLAGSCIESTRLALESFSLEGSGLRAPGEELMGRNYMFHVRADIAFRVERARLAAYVQQKWPGTTLADFLQLASLHIQCEGANGTYQYQLYAATNADGPDSNMYKMVPDLDIQRSIRASYAEDKVSFILRSSGEVKGGRAARTRDPNFDFLDLAGDADFDREFGHRRAWVQFKTANGDHSGDAIYKDMHDTAHAIARALANGGTLEYTPVNGSADFSLGAIGRQQKSGSTFHDSGTLWMGDNPDTSVTDVNGHFHHVTNAYCADQALFTTVGSANPALTGLALARKVAANIVSRHQSYVPKVPLPAGFSIVPLGDADGWLTAPYNGMIDVGEGIVETAPRDGVIGLYYLPQELGNFELMVEWKAYRTPAAPNAGVLLRTPDPRTVNLRNTAEADAFYDASVEIQIDDEGKNYNRDRFPNAIFGDSRYKTGAVYGVAPARQWAGSVLAPDGLLTGERYWNTYHITARGNEVTVLLNGKMTSKATLPGGKRDSGFVALQFHSGRIQFRNVRLKS